MMDRSNRHGFLVPLTGLGIAAVAAMVGFQGSQPTLETDMVVATAPTPPVRLPMEMNARVEKWIDRFTTDQKHTFQTFLEREGLYSEIILAELRERGMPEELLYLAMIESGFSPRATSAASAAGVWQFMGPTAQEYGLRVDRWVDERRDPVKATAAALDYLGWLHARYDSWYLAAAAYNAGPGTVDRVLKRHAEGRRGDEDIYWEIIEHLPRETREYVPRLLAAATLASEAGRYGFAASRLSPYKFDRVWVPGRTPLREIAVSLEVDLETMRYLNPHLVLGVTPPGAPYALRVPVGASPLVVASLGTGRMRRTDD